MFKTSSCEPNLDALPNVLNSICQYHFCIVIVLRLAVSQSRKRKKATAGILTCNLAASSQTSSLFGHCSQPCLIIFRAATILPACSSKQAAAIHPGACFGLDLTNESKSIRARLISPISASDFMTTLSREVRYPLGSTDVDVPEEVDVPEI